MKRGGREWLSEGSETVLYKSGIDENDVFSSSSKSPLSVHNNEKQSNLENIR